MVVGKLRKVGNSLIERAALLVVVTMLTMLTTLTSLDLAARM